MESDWPERIEPDGAFTEEPPTFGEAKLNALTPMGQADSLGDFARGLGPRRVKIVFGASAALVIAIAVLSSLG